MIPVAFSPPADLLRDLPDHIPTELGISAWQAGIQDGMSDLAPFTLPEFTDLQPLYDRGYATGDRTRAIARMLDSRPGRTTAEPEEDEELAPAQWAHNALHVVVSTVDRFARSTALRFSLGLLLVFAICFWLFVIVNGATPWR